MGPARGASTVLEPTVTAQLIDDHAKTPTNPGIHRDIGVLLPERTPPKSHHAWQQMPLRVGNLRCSKDSVNSYGERRVL
jgi:hypothetical protein